MRTPWAGARARVEPPSLLASALLLLAWPLSLGAQGSSTEWVDLDRISSGEIYFDFGGETAFRGLIRAAVLIEAGPTHIWTVLKDCESAPEYTPHVLECVLEESAEDGRTEVFRQTVKYAWFLPRFEHLFSLTYEPYSDIEVSRVSGPIEHMEGRWRLEPSGDMGVLLTYVLELEPGLPVPRFMVGASLRKDIPMILGEIRTRAETAAGSEY